MIPLRDNVRSRRVPLVNYVIIGVTSLVFILQLQDEGGHDLRLVERFGMIPQRVIHPEKPIIVESRGYHPVFGFYHDRRPVAASPLPAFLTLLTCIFLHGGWLHFLGNMWFLYIFGDNVEDRLGRAGYVIFYLGAGVVASAAQLIVNPDSTVPTIGASGAIAGVMGAYFVLYPGARVLTLVPIFFFIEILVLPAAIFLGVWFALQFFQGTLAITAAAGGGVAWWAHIGGFAAGVVTGLVIRFSPFAERRPAQFMEDTRRGVRYRRYGYGGRGRW